MSTRLVLPARPADPSAAQALFREARRRRRRRWLAGMTMVLVIVTAVAVSTLTSTHRVLAAGPRRARGRPWRPGHRGCRLV